MPRASGSQHEKFAEQFGGHAAAMMLDSLPRLAMAMKSGNKATSFTVTAQLTRTKGGALVLDLNPRERVPLKRKRFAVQLEGEQLSLLDELTDEGKGSGDAE